MKVISVEVLVLEFTNSVLTFLFSSLLNTRLKEIKILI